MNVLGRTSLLLACLRASAWSPSPLAPEEPGRLLRATSPGPDASFAAQEEQAVASFLTKRLAGPEDERHPFWRFEWEQLRVRRVATCSVVMLLAGLLCSAGGIGGGGIYVSVLMVAGSLSPRDAVPLSKAVVFCGSLASLALNVRRVVTVEEGTTQSVIDYDICRIVVPAALIGTLLGVLFNHNAADSFIVLLLCAILMAMATAVVWTTWRQYTEEQAQAAAEQRGERPVAEPPKAAPSKRPQERHSARPQDILLGFLMLTVIVASGVMRHHTGACIWQLEQRGPTEACRHPMLSLLVGNRMEGWMSDPTRAGWAMLMTLVLPVSACLAVMAFYSKACVQQARLKPSEVAIYEIMGVLTGCLAGLVGVGGGLIFSPFFLTMGVEPMVAVATSSTCVIFTSSSTTLQYLLTDRIIVSLTIVYGLVNLVASYGGTAFVHFLQDRFATRKSYITAIVAAGVLLSAVLSVSKLAEGSEAAVTESGL